MEFIKDWKLIKLLKIKLNEKPSPKWLVFFLDISIAVSALFLAYCLRFNFHVPEYYRKTWELIFPIVLLLKALIYIIFNCHAQSFRYIGINDLLNIFYFNLVAFCILFLLNTLLSLTNNISILPFSVLFNDFLLALLGMMLLRLIVKYIYEQYLQLRRETTLCAIICSWKDAQLISKLLEVDKNRKYKIIALFEKDRRKKGFFIKGTPTYHISKFEQIIKKESIETVILQKGFLKEDLKTQIIDICLQEKIRILTFPMLRMSLNILQLKELKMEDLLERDPIRLDLNKISNFLMNKTIAVTGAAGSIGSEIVKQIVGFNPKKLILIDQAESPMYELELDLKKTIPTVKYIPIIGDICDKNHMDRIFAQYKPEIVYHAAAYKHVPMMEENPCEAFKTNVLGTVNLVQCSLKYNVTKFIMISTDKAVNPTNVMGATKRLAEMYVQTSQKFAITDFITTRFGNVIGSNGSVVLLFKKQIENGGPVTVTHPEVTRFFMTIPEACQLVLEASVAGKGGEIFVFNMGERVKILDLAIKMIKLAGFIPNEDIKIVFTGLRPGEKLYEELIHDKENNLPTYHPKLMIAKTREIDFEKLHIQLQEFYELVNQRNSEEIVRRMKQLIPEYISNNSKYTALDSRN